MHDDHYIIKYLTRQVANWIFVHKTWHRSCLCDPIVITFNYDKPAADESRSENISEGKASVDGGVENILKKWFFQPCTAEQILDSGSNFNIHERVNKSAASSLAMYYYSSRRWRQTVSWTRRPISADNTLVYTFFTLCYFAKLRFNGNAHEYCTYSRRVCVCACGICALRPYRQRAVPSIRFYIKCEYVSLVRDPPHSDIICLLPCGANIEEFRVVELSAFRSLGPASRFPFRVGCSNISDCSDLTNILYGQVTDVYA